MTDEQRPAPASELLPCPFCGEQLVLSSDHHGEWWAHQKEPGPCIDSTTQLHNANDFTEWNTRPIENQLRAALASERDRADKAEATIQAKDAEIERLTGDSKFVAAEIAADLAQARAEVERLRGALQEVARDRDFVVRCNDYIQGVVALATSEPGSRKE